MAKTLTFTYKDREYTLEFTRRTVTEMERRGFKAEEVTKQPMTYLPQLFEGAFLVHHRYVKKDLIDEIYSHMTERQELIGKLVDMYNDPMMQLIDEPEEGAEGNVSWAANW